MNNAVMSNNPNQISAPSKAPPSKILAWWNTSSKFQKNCREITAILLWAYCLLHLFVFNVDDFLIALLGADFSWPIQHKFVIFQILVAALFFVPRRFALPWLTFVGFYPVIFLGRVMFYIAAIVAITKSWNVLFTSLNLILSFFQNFKFNLAVVALCSLSIVVITSAADPALLYMNALILLLVCLTLVIRKLISIFTPSKLFKVHANILGKMIGYSQKQLVKPLKLPSGGSLTKESEISQRLGDLQIAIIGRETCLYVARKLNAYNKSNLQMMFYVCNFIAMVVALVLLFAYVNYAIFKANYSNFVITNPANFFDFVYYSFNKFFLQTVPEVTPISVVARSLAIFQMILSVMLTLILLTLFFMVKKDLDAAEIEKAANELKAQSDTIKKFIFDEFSLTIEDAIKRIDQVKTGLSIILAFLQGAADRLEPLVPNQVIDQSPPEPPSKG